MKRKEKKNTRKTFRSVVGGDTQYTEQWKILFQNRQNKYIDKKKQYDC